MKRILCIFLVICICFGFSGCEKKDDKIEKIVDQAAEVLAKKWKTVYDESEYTTIGNDRYLEIKNTRIVYIKDTGIEELKDVDYFIDFVLFSNYAGTAPYYTNIEDVYDTVAVYKDGTMDADLDVVAWYTGTYGNDFSKLVESIEDYNGDYNRIIKVEK